MKHDARTSSRRQMMDPLVLLFSLTLFLSAALMFAVQPLVGKMLLPLVGGAPSGWLVAMAYFQLALLAGYFLAHRLSFFPARLHGLILVLALLAGLSMQPVQMSHALLDVKNIPESFRVFLLLLAQLTLPFLALAMLSPSLQRLFAHSGSPAAGNPYFLFAASNIGSFGGLLLYPLWMERSMGLLAQSHLWRAGYLLLVLLVATCWLLTTRKESAPREAKSAEALPPLPWRQRGKWLVLSFLPSSLMLGVTAHITVDIGAVPFFWVLPLALYLLTFVLAFMRESTAGEKILRQLQPFSVAILVFDMVEQPTIITSLKMFQMIFPLSVFFLTSLLAHFMLASSRPAPRRLTEFYLYVATGGALGGIFNAFVAPFLFPLPIEFYLVALAGCWVFPRPEKWFFSPFRRGVPFAVFGALLSAVALYCFRLSGGSLAAIYAASLLLLLTLLRLVERPRYLALTGGGLLLIALLAFGSLTLLDVQRNFFGVIRVYEQQEDGVTLRTMSHGSTTHGFQKVAPDPETIPDAYYHPLGPLGDVMAVRAPRDVGVVGMGTGATVCYEAPERKYTFYEIDPHVPPLAAKWFDYMRVCGDPRIVMGDGRKGLAEDPGARYDLLIIDAFTSDAIPLHLLTQEALLEYKEKLAADGIVLFHITNRFYNFRAPLSGLARATGLHALAKSYKSSNLYKTGASSDWVAFAATAATLAPLRERGWIDLPSSQERLWTDDYSNLLSALKKD
ncbi:MAG: fused MFS/spermidine synthase [Alphaproteobacteria bacterium]|nr:fused MFS/spermidine synthase [Alphaproteobacteria bacterium]